MENSFKNLLDSAQEVLILLPSKPYLDQVAASLSLYLSLRQSGKNATISSSATMTAEFSRLIAVDKITKELGNKNLVVKFVNYQANNVDKVSYDIEDEEFKLTIAPKSGVDAPTKEQVNISYSGIAADTVFLIGGANDSHFPELKKDELKNAKLIHIGTRLLDVKSDLEILSFARPASSVCEITASLIREVGLSVDQDIATNLLAGIETESKGFQGADVTPETFMLFGELLRIGGQRMRKEVANNYPQGAIPNKPYTQKQVLNSSGNGSSQPKQQNPLDEEIPLPEEEPKDIPQSWTEPRIYTGTTVS